MKLPWWAIGYLAAFILRGIAGGRDDFSDKKPVLGVLGLCSTAVMTWLALGFWYPALIRIPQLLGFLLISLSVVLECFAVYGELQDPELPGWGKCLVGFLVFALLVPAYYFAIVAMNRRTDGVG